MPAAVPPLAETPDRLERGREPWENKSAERYRSGASWFSAPTVHHGHLGKVTKAHFLNWI